MNRADKVEGWRLAKQSRYSCQDRAAMPCTYFAISLNGKFRVGPKFVDIYKLALDFLDRPTHPPIYKCEPNLNLIQPTDAWGSFSVLLQQCSISFLVVKHVGCTYFRVVCVKEDFFLKKKWSPRVVNN